MIKSIEYISQTIDEISQMVTDNVSDNNQTIWHNAEKQIKRKIGLFDSDKHFIIVTGMLKAGKSTLIDLLARTTKASLVGFGVDTTLRPAVIKMSNTDQGNIYVYYPIVGIDPSVAMQEIIDSLRGIKEYSKDAGSYNLTENNLRKILCCKPEESDNMLSQEPLLVVVEVPYNADSQIFKNNCILLDMPGLDSGFSETSKDSNKYKAFFDECDLLLFVQSSVSPINDKAAEYLNYIGLTREESTYKLVQNIMNAKYWLKNSVTDKEQQNQAKNGKEVFKHKIGKPNAEVTPVYVNLGMAFDSILGNEQDIETDNATLEDKKQKLLQESKFIEMEDNFVRDIKNNGQKLHELHCKDMLIKEINHTIDETKKQIEDLQKQIQDNEKTMNDYRKKIDIIKRRYQEYQFIHTQFVFSSGFDNRLKEKLFLEFEAIRKTETFKNKLSQDAADENTDKSIHCKATTANEFIERCAARAKEISEQYLKDTYLDDLVYKENNIEHSAIQYAQEGLKTEATNLSEHGITINAEKISTRANIIGEIDKTFCFTTYDGGKFEVVRPWYKFGFQNKIDFNKNSKYNDIVSHYQKELNRLIANNTNIVVKLTNLVRDALKEELLPQQTELEQNLDKLNTLTNTLNKDKDTLNKLLEKLKGCSKT